MFAKPMPLSYLTRVSASFQIAVAKLAHRTICRAYLPLLVSLGVALPSGKTDGQEYHEWVGLQTETWNIDDLSETSPSSTWYSLPLVDNETLEPWQLSETDATTAEIWIESVAELPVGTDPSLSENATLTSAINVSPEVAPNESMHGYVVMAILFLVAGGVGCLQLSH